MGRVTRTTMSLPYVHPTIRIVCVSTGSRGTRKRASMLVVDGSLQKLAHEHLVNTRSRVVSEKPFDHKVVL
jgi:hypothetical protein